MDADTTDSFHVYTLEWTEKQMTFKFDGQTTFKEKIMVLPGNMRQDLRIKKHTPHILWPP